MNSLNFDITQASKFLSLLDEGEEEFTFQTFDDKEYSLKIFDKDEKLVNEKRIKRGNKELADVRHGTIEKHFDWLSAKNKAGAGIFVMAQSGNGSGRNNESVDRIRCIFNENDNGLTKALPLDPQIVVESSPGKRHYYFLCEGIEKSEFKPIEERLIDEYGSDPNAKDLARVLRLPGFYHNKGLPHKVSITHESGGLPYTAEQIKAAFPPVINGHKKTYKSEAKTDIEVTDKLIDDLRNALRVIPSVEYSDWINIGMALKCLGDKGFILWQESSSNCKEKFDFNVCYEKWDSFNPTDITYKSIFHKAKEFGLKNDKNTYSDTSDTIPSSFTWVTGEELAKNAKAPVFLINKILETDSHGMIAGDSMSYKSFVVLKMAHSICTGNDFFDNVVYKTGKVLYISGEGRESFGRRVKGLEIVEKTMGDNFLFLADFFCMDDASQMNVLSSEIERIRPALVIFDTFSSLVSVSDENAAKDVARVLNLRTRTCRHNGVSSILVHHYGKDVLRGMRGSIVFKTNNDFEFSLKRENGTKITELSCVKMKDAENFDPIIMKAHVVDLGLVNQDGTQSTTLVLKKCDPSEVHEESLTDRQQKAYDGIRELISISGFEADKKLCVNEEMIKSLFRDLFEEMGNDRYKVFGKVIPPLLKKGLLHVKDKNYWL